jgi:outer membrane protein OmpA-like peptidoglycan-associated protein
MSNIGVRWFALRQIFLTVILSSGATSWAQGEAKPPPIELKYESFDLNYPVSDLKDQVEALKAESQSATGSGADLKSEIVDLAAKGIDIKESETEIKINLLGDILFDFDKATIRAAAEPTLGQIAKFLQSRAKAKVLIEGHTDAKGSAGYNAKLSERRAASVKDWFGKHGVTSRTIETRGLGAAKPVASNKKPDGSDDPDGRQKNRRVEITIKK